MRRTELEAAAANVTYLRGLFGLPLGALFLVTGLGNLQWGPLRSDGVFVLCLAAIAAGWALLTRFYDEHYGRVTTRSEPYLRTALPYAFYLGALVGGPLLDAWLDPSVSPLAALFAVAALSWYALRVQLRAYHVVVWGALLVGALIPVWDSFDDSTSVAFLPIGVATIVSGLLDHRALVAGFGAARDLDVEGTHGVA
jgi:hypothetical protein